MSENIEKTKSVPTYIKINGEGSVLEFDLVTFRQKGEEAKYLSVYLTGADITKDPPVEQEAFVSLNEDGFKKLKSFFAQLEWDK